MVWAMVWASLLFVTPGEIKGQTLPTVPEIPSEIPVPVTPTIPKTLPQVPSASAATSQIVPPTLSQQAAPLARRSLFSSTTKTPSGTNAPLVLPLPTPPVTGPTPATRTQGVPDAPPKMPTEYVPRKPEGSQGSFVWIPGHWGWNGENYVWVKGFYQPPPTNANAWIPGKWVERFAEWYWTDGKWVAVAKSSSASVSR